MTFKRRVILDLSEYYLTKYIMKIRLKCIYNCTSGSIILYQNVHNYSPGFVINNSNRKFLTLREFEYKKQLLKIPRK